MREPGVSRQSAWASQPPFAVEHSFTFVQVSPSPLKPGLQSHRRPEGCVSSDTQTASAPQPPPPAQTTGASHAVPSPVQPWGHAQVRLPGVFVHCADAWQPPLFVEHSFTSVQVLPSPL